MPKAHPKSPETIQAQIAAFGAERLADYTDKAHLMKHIGELAAGGIVDVSRTLERTEYHPDKVTEDNPRGRVETGEEVSVATGQEYLDFLRSRRGREYDPIRVRAEILEAYKEFEPTIRELKQELLDPSKRHEHGTFLGSGTNSQVFEIIKDGRRYAVRLPIGADTKPAAIDSHLAGAVLANDLPHYEHIAAASYEDGVTVAEIMPGREVDTLSVADVDSITEDQLRELIDTLIAGHERGVVIDPKPSNYFYDRDQGFGIVDFHSSKVNERYAGEQSLSDKISDLSAVICNFGLQSLPSDRESPAYYQTFLEYSKVHVGLLETFRKLVERKLAPEDAQPALLSIDARLESTMKNVDDYADPRWVSDSVTREKQLRLAREVSMKQWKESKEPAGWGTTGGYEGGDFVT